MKENIYFKLAEFFSPKIYTIKAFFGRTKNKHIKKQSKLGRDVVLGLIQVLSVRHLEVGVKVITRNGIGHIKEIKNQSWALISYNNGRWEKDVLINKCFQYFFSVKNTYNNTIKLYPLSYSDYKYIHPEWDNNKWLEGHITKLKYFQLTTQEKETYAHLPYFNKSMEGKYILEKLEGKEIDLKFKDTHLITIKRK